jgi:hypothetical protein
MEDGIYNNGLTVIPVKSKNVPKNNTRIPSWMYIHYQSCVIWGQNRLQTTKL